MSRAFFHGFILALGLILPLGVQNLFVLQQGMLQPRLLQAAPAVVTAALCDTVLICCAVGGMSLVLLELAYLRIGLIALGSLFLFYMGWKNWCGSQTLAAPGIRTRVLGTREQVLFALSVSLLNPYAFMDILGVIGTSSLQYAGGEKLAFTVAPVLVSGLWFPLLSLVGHGLDFLPAALQRPGSLQRFSALFMWGSAVYLLSQLF